MSLLYPIVSSIKRAEFFLLGETPYLQLRFKEGGLSQEMVRVSEWTQRYAATRIVVNDDPELAEKVGAWGVHLGQEDLKKFSAHELKNSPLHLGISTHSPKEIEMAFEWEPSYLGFGPIFATQTKTLSVAPQGVEALQSVVATHSIPIVAIGGITENNLMAVAQTGVHAIAMISGLDACHDLPQLHQFKKQIET